MSQTCNVVEIVAVEGDITTVEVDAVVNAANRAMRGGGGVDGAIHRAGGPAILADCIERFPDGLATGDAGWTTAGNLPARWVIHTVGPNYNAGEDDRSLLVSCYRRSLQVADELGVRTIAFPLISAGIYGWPLRDAIDAAVETIATTDTNVAGARIVALGTEVHEEVVARLTSRTPFRILQGVRTLHRRGYHSVRVLPGVSASGMHWRVTITDMGNVSEAGAQGDPSSVLRYSTGSGTEFAGVDVTEATSPDQVADVILAALPDATAQVDDPVYVQWYDELMQLVESRDALPVAYADYFDETDGWEIGWGSGTRYPHPPACSSAPETG